MSPYAALHGLRIGCVQYLNSKPLIRDYDGPVIFDHPSRLASELAADRLDAALVPCFELLRRSEYRVVDGVSISSRGPVFSVFLAFRGPLSEVRRVALDPASVTSCHLLQCVLSEFHHLHPDYTAAAMKADARLLIGNQAIDFRSTAAAEWSFLDLGEEWTRGTGLPFVYALWLIRPDLPDAVPVAEALRRLKQGGMALRKQICAAETAYGAEFSHDYLHRHIRYELGPDEKAGLRKFEELLEKLGHLPAVARQIEYL